MASKTYFCGGNGLIKRLDDHTLPWVDISDGFDNYLDIKTQPTESDVVVVCGENGVMKYSTDSGATWTSSTLPAGVGNIYELTWSSLSKLYACCEEGKVIVSMDAGINWTYTASFPTDTGFAVPESRSKCIDFSSDLRGVCGWDRDAGDTPGAYLYSTSDGGTTWTVQNSGNPIDSTSLLGCAVLQDAAHTNNVVCVGTTDIYQTTNFGTSYFSRHSFTGTGQHLTWEEKSPIVDTLWALGSGNERLKSVNSGVTWATVSSHSGGTENNRGGHMYTDDEGYIAIDMSMYTTGDSMATSVLSIAEAYDIQAVWTGTKSVCYRLVDCDGVYPDIITDDDLSAELGSYVQIINMGHGGGFTCYHVQLADDCAGAVSVNIANTFETCIDCETGGGATIYELTQCNTPKPLIYYTDQDLSAYVDQVIQWEGQWGCFEVRTIPYFPHDFITLTVIDTRAFCVDCNCFRLVSCDPDSYPDIPDAQPIVGVDLINEVGNIITHNLIPNQCYTVETQLGCNVPGYTVSSIDSSRDDCAELVFTPQAADFVTTVNTVDTVDITVTNNSAADQDITFALSGCTSTEITVTPASPQTVVAGGNVVLTIQYAPLVLEQGNCTLNVQGDCVSLDIPICYRSIPEAEAGEHFEICIKGGTDAPNCISPGESVVFNIGGHVVATAYPLTVNFDIIEQSTGNVLYTNSTVVNDDTELDALTETWVATDPGTYCAVICLSDLASGVPCNAKSELCFTVCQPFDIYKDGCNDWHVHRPHDCSMTTTYYVTVTELEGDVVINNQQWDTFNNPTFNFEVPGDGIYILTMSDDEGNVIYSFSFIEACAINNCYMILMDKIMCSCADPCCTKCNGTPQKEVEFARMTLNKLVPLYLTYLAIARKNEVYQHGLQLITVEHECFLHEANAVMDKILELVEDCGCICKEENNTAANRGGCSSC